MIGDTVGIPERTVLAALVAGIERHSEDGRSFAAATLVRGLPPATRSEIIAELLAETLREDQGAGIAAIRAALSP